MENAPKSNTTEIRSEEKNQFSNEDIKNILKND